MILFVGIYFPYLKQYINIKKPEIADQYRHKNLFSVVSIIILESVQNEHKFTLVNIFTEFLISIISSNMINFPFIVIENVISLRTFHIERNGKR